MVKTKVWRCKLPESCSLDTACNTIKAHFNNKCDIVFLDTFTKFRVPDQDHVVIIYDKIHSNILDSIVFDGLFYIDTPLPALVGQ